MSAEAVVPGDEVVVALRRAAQDIFERSRMTDLDGMMSQLVAAAVAMVPGATGGGISRIETGTIRASHATSNVVYALDARQAELGEGPCITAADAPPEDGSVLVTDLAGVDAARWPNFAPSAVELGFRSMLSTHLGSRPGGRRSALNLYAPEPNTFDAQARVSAGLFAVPAAALLHGADEAGALSRAIDSRDVIGQAKGLLMERFVLDDSEAFQMLIESSQQTNLKVIDIARWMLSEAQERRTAKRTGGG